MREFRPDPGRAASFGRKGGGGILELIPGRCFFFLDDTRERGGEEERKKERVDTEKDKNKEKEIKAQAYTTT